VALFCHSLQIVTDGVRRALVSCLFAFLFTLLASVYSVLVVRISESPTSCQHVNQVQHKVKLTSIEDGHGGAAEELTASGTELNLYRQYVSGSPPKS
jgi:hypothetical protein